MIREQPYYLGGQWASSATPLDVTNPYSRATFARTWLADDTILERAIQAAVEAAPVLGRMPAHERAAALEHAARELAANRDAIAQSLAGEAGKPVGDARTEVDRATMTLGIAAEEARRLMGEVIPLDRAPHGENRLAITRRFPIGPVAGISPFNFPLNLSAHKIAPAIAAGNPIVLKPATKTPLSALALAAALHGAGLPPGSVSVLPMARQTGDRLATDERFKLLTFTGSSAVGWALKARAGKKKVILELGGNAGVVIDDTANLDYAAARVATGGFAFAGQSCISVQRVLVHDRIFDDFAGRLVSRLERLRIGDPLDPATELGPLIDAGEADRIEAWVAEAVGKGARVVTGGRRLGPTIYAPTVLADIPPDAKVCTHEVFGPLVGLYRFTDFPDAVRELNRTPYGLQAGIFTTDLDKALEAFDRFEVGGVIVNDVPTYRIDHMPYGGVKDSGHGREGPRYTIEEMTELKLLVINRHAG